MQWVVKLYLLGVLLSILSALFGLMGFLDDLLLRLRWDLQPCLPGQRTDSEGVSPRDAQPKALGGDVVLRTHKALGSHA